MNAIREDAEQFVRQVEAQTGIRLNFDLPSLFRLDALLAEWIDLASVYDALGAREMVSLVRPLASFIGETLCASVSAAWERPVVDTSAMPVLRLCTGQKLDIEEAVLTILRGRARPAFHELALALLKESHGGTRYT